MTKHKKARCHKLRNMIFVEGLISEWKCPICKLIFQCGDERTSTMYCSGI